MLWNNPPNPHVHQFIYVDEKFAFSIQRVSYLIWQFYVILFPKELPEQTRRNLIRNAGMDISKHNA